jgi:hypothetical protein
MRRALAVLAIVMATVGASGAASATPTVLHEAGTSTGPCWDHVHPAVDVTGSYNLWTGVDQGGTGSWVIGSWSFTTAAGHRATFFVLYQVTDQGHEWIGRSVFTNDVLGSSWDLVAGTAYFSSGGYFAGNSTGTLVDLCPVLGYHG